MEERRKEAAPRNHGTTGLPDHGTTGLRDYHGFHGWHGWEGTAEKGLLDYGTRVKKLKAEI